MRSTAVAFCGAGKIARRGRRGSQEGWFLPDDGGLDFSAIPGDAQLACSSDGKAVAFYRESQRGERNLCRHCECE